MRVKEKKRADDFVQLLQQAQEQIKVNIEKQQMQDAGVLLEACQETAIALGTMIEQSEGEGTVTVSLLESYCEEVYRLHEAVMGRQTMDALKIYKVLKLWHTKIQNSLNHDIKVRKEVVFFPYKASMWDSLESIYLAAARDPDCDAYVVPIPYYDRNAEGNLQDMHYEGECYPKEIPITSYKDYNFANRQPDVIYIHNPYDEYNRVSSVHPFFYSKNLKRFTSKLVYVPYYSTAGQLSEEHADCPVYEHVDYIITQAEHFVESFDSKIPREKILPLGSPKFDKVIRLCENLPKPMEEWKRQTEGKKVYFYNTSLNGMLSDTEAFFKKMEYVFSCFQGKKQACLLWRPHPLMQSTIESMRPEYTERFETLKRRFIDEKLGIYDDTPDMEKTIALGDAYIGDSGTSVTSIFGVAGKPLFILNNYVHQKPEKEDYRGEIAFPLFHKDGDNRYQVTQNNELWYAPKNDFHYEFYMKLSSEYQGGGYYLGAFEREGRIYVLPMYASHILVIENKTVIKKIELRKQTTGIGMFYDYCCTNRYIFLLPMTYHSLVRYDMHTGEVHYLTDINKFNVSLENGDILTGARRILGEYLYIGSPIQNRILKVHVDTMNFEEISCPSKCQLGIADMIQKGEELWLLPGNGFEIRRWNLTTGQVKEYDKFPEGFETKSWLRNTVVEGMPFYTMVFFEDKALFAPWYGNMFVELDIHTGEMRKWEFTIQLSEPKNTGYMLSDARAYFLPEFVGKESEVACFWYFPEREVYEVNFKTGKYKKLTLDYKNIQEHEPGFAEQSEWLQYACMENANNSLEDFITGEIKGSIFDRDRARRAFMKVNGSPNGDCGEKVHRFMMEH